MATHSVGANEIGTYEKTLTANVVDTVTFGRDLTQVEVINEGTAPIYFTVDGSTPVVGSPSAFYVPAGSVRTVRLWLPGAVAKAPAVPVVKLISTGAAKYGVSEAT